MAALDLDLREEQVLLRDAVQRMVARVESPSWQDLARELGLAGLTLPAEVGGFGGGPVDVAVVMAELGPALAGADWLSHAAACLALGHGACAQAIMADLASGAQRAALVSTATAGSMPTVQSDGRIEGTARLVAGAAEAARFVVAGADDLWLVPAAATGLRREIVALHDGSVGADLHFEAAAGVSLGGDAEAAAALVRAGRCAEAVGLMQRMLADTAGYLNQRRQFGAPIASFQVLRHRLADMQLAALQSQALTEAAVAALHERGPDRGVTVAAACVAVRDAARVVGEGAVQLHGAMGLTEELRLGARFKRLLAIAAGLGSEAEALDRYAAAEQLSRT